MEIFGLEKSKLQKITLYAIAALTLIAVVLLLVVIMLSVDKDVPAGGGEIENVDFKLTEATVTKDQLQKGTLLIVNATHPYSIPEDLNLSNIAAYRNERDDSYPYQIANPSAMQLETEALANAHNMLMAVKNDDVQISSAFRTVEDQNAISSTIQGGHSDHHTGMLISLTGYQSADISSAYTWLNENAYKYGFVLRYPDSKAEITGVSDYTTAYRYVGIAHATYMSANGMCLEEYVEYLKNNTTCENMLTVSGNNGSTYGVYYCEADEGDTIFVPDVSDDDKLSYTVSGTNDGGVVITVTIE